MKEKGARLALLNMLRQSKPCSADPEFIWMVYRYTLCSVDTIASPASLQRRTTTPSCTLGEALSKEQCELHAYVLMTNHVHLLLTPGQAESVPRLIIALGRRYVQYINTTSNVPAHCGIAVSLSLEQLPQQCAWPSQFAHYPPSAIPRTRLDRARPAAHLSCPVSH